ncbi:hypothetical protein EYR40_008381 [Pleurotus pulmonarius]|nr:hypothetical protein EYR40_008381 [Pleurotus pulmonarius]
MPANSKANRKTSLSSYYKRNQESLRAKARERMAATRARKALTQTPEEQAAAKASIRSSQAKYRENNRSALRNKEHLRRERKKLTSLGFFDSPDNDDHYSEYEYSSDASNSSSSSEEDWEAETEVFSNLQARANAEENWLAGGSWGVKLNVRTHQFHSRSTGSLSTASTTIGTTIQRPPSPPSRIDFMDDLPPIHALNHGHSHSPSLGNLFSLDPAYLAHLAELDTDEDAPAPRTKKPSDQPLMVFLGVLDTYLQEMVRHEGLGADASPGVCNTLLRRLKNAVATCAEQIESHYDFEKRLGPAVVTPWRVAVELWEADSSQPNPFALAVKTMSQHAVRLELNEEEAALIAQGKLELFHEDVTPCILISSGLDLEEQQRSLAKDIGGLGLHATDRQRVNIVQRANVLRNKINVWLDHQKLYCPGAFVLRGGEPSQITDPVNAVPSINLWLPSSIGHRATCPTGLREIEWKLRLAQAHDALNQIRTSLQIRAGVFQQKDRFERGQRAMTRSCSVIARLQDKIDECVERYRVALHGEL